MTPRPVFEHTPESVVQTPCPHCSGTGQLNYFKGESRFVLSQFECPICCGTGVDREATDTEPDNAPADARDEAAGHSGRPPQTRSEMP
jgi:hypothetical protein